MKTIRHGRRVHGFSRVEAITSVVVLAVLIAVLLPALMAAKRKGSRISCANSLKQVGLSFLQWSLDNHDKFPMQVSVTNGGSMELVGRGVVYQHFQIMSNELSTPMILVCPEDKKTWKKARAALALVRETNVGWSNPFPTNFPVSYFVGVDAQRDRPKMFLSGDANLAVGGKPAKPGLLSLWTNSPVAWAKPLRPYHGDGGNTTRCFYLEIAILRLMG
jgi:hypothetical protein